MSVLPMSVIVPIGMPASVTISSFVSSVMLRAFMLSVLVMSIYAVCDLLPVTLAVTVWVVA